jgi:hypothetical protein
MEAISHNAIKYLTYIVPNRMNHKNTNLHSLSSRGLSPLPPSYSPQSLTYSTWFHLLKNKHYTISLLHFLTKSYHRWPMYPQWIPNGPTTHQLFFFSSSFPFIPYKVEVLSMYSIIRLNGIH